MSCDTPLGGVAGSFFALAVAIDGAGREGRGSAGAALTFTGGAAGLRAAEDDADTEGTAMDEGAAVSTGEIGTCTAGAEGAGGTVASSVGPVGAKGGSNQ